MERKNAHIYLVSSVIIGLVILIAVWLGEPVERNDLSVTFSQGSLPGTTDIHNVAPSYQYRLNEGFNWVNVTGDSVENIAVRPGDSIFIRDIDVPGLAERYILTEEDILTP